MCWVSIWGQLLAFLQITSTNSIILPWFSMAQFPTCPMFLFQLAGFLCQWQTLGGGLCLLFSVYLVPDVSLAEGFCKLCY